MLLYDERIMEVQLEIRPSLNKCSDRMIGARRVKLEIMTDQQTTQTFQTVLKVVRLRAVVL